MNKNEESQEPHFIVKFLFIVAVVACAIWFANPFVERPTDEELKKDEVIREMKVKNATITAHCDAAVTTGFKIDFNNRIVEAAACESNKVSTLQLILDSLAVSKCLDNIEGAYDIGLGDKVSEQMRNCYNDHRTSVARQVVTHVNIFKNQK